MSAQLGLEILPHCGGSLREKNDSRERYSIPL